MVAKETFTVIGSFEVAGKQPGETITREELEEYGALVDPLVQGGHLEPGKGTATSKAEPKKAGEA